jgi:hypothetical protein
MNGRKNTEHASDPTQTAVRHAIPNCSGCGSRLEPGENSSREKVALSVVGRATEIDAKLKLMALEDPYLEPLRLRWPID